MVLATPPSRYALIGAHKQHLSRQSVWQKGALCLCSVHAKVVGFIRPESISVTSIDGKFKDSFQLELHFKCVCLGQRLGKYFCARHTTSSVPLTMAVATTLHVGPYCSLPVVALQLLDYGDTDTTTIHLARIDSRSLYRLFFCVQNIAR